MTTSGVHADESDAFQRWQMLQRKLHDLQERITRATLDAKLGLRDGVPEQWITEAQGLRQEMDALFPAAMAHLETQISTELAKRRKLHD